MTTPEEQHEQGLAKRRAYYAAHRDEILARRRAYRAAHPEVADREVARWRARRREELRRLRSLEGLPN
jgi:hypothetical protein